MTVTTQNVSQSLLDAVNGTGSKAKSKAEETEDRFLTLLVEQMKNQDPLNPMENAQVTSQMAQLSTVTGIDKLNETMASMIGSMQASQSYQAASMIGHNVLVPGNTINYSGESSFLGYETTTGADNVALEIKNKSGEVIKTIQLNNVESGPKVVQWDGTKKDGTKAAAGDYTFNVTAKVGSESVTVSPLAFATVTSVSTDASGVKLSLNNKDSVSTSAVKEIF